VCVCWGGATEQFQNNKTLDDPFVFGKKEVQLEEYLSAFVSYHLPNSSHNLDYLIFHRERAPMQTPTFRFLCSHQGWCLQLWRGSYSWCNSIATWAEFFGILSAYLEIPLEQWHVPLKNNLMYIPRDFLVCFDSIQLGWNSLEVKSLINEFRLLYIYTWKNVTMKNPV
jgi:hypothetical protein